MIIDIICGILILLAFFNGYKKGIIDAVLSIFAIVLGIIIALNFSTIVTSWLIENFNLPTFILPALSFILVIIVVILALKLVANLAEKILKTVMLNFVNKLAGGIVWSLLATVILSLLLFFVNKTGIFTESLISESFALKTLLPLAPTFLELISALIPKMKESFLQLNQQVQDLPIQQ